MITNLSPHIGTTVFGQQLGELRLLRAVLRKQIMLGKTVTVHRNSYALTRAMFSGAWLKRTSCIFVVLSPKTVLVFPRMSMCRTLLDLAPALGTPTSSHLLFAPKQTNSSASQTGLSFGRFAEQSPLPGYRSSRGEQCRGYDGPLAFMEGKHWIDLQTGEDIAPTLAVSEVDERSDLEQVRPHSESSETSSLRFRTGMEKPSARCPNRRKSSSRLTCWVGASFRKRRIRSEHRDYPQLP